MTPALREIEVKRLLLGEGAGDRLIAALNASVEREMRQVNHVFDTDDGRLAASRHALRLRFEDGDRILTAKGPSTAVGVSTTAKLEAEANVTTEVAAAILSGGLDPIAALRTEVADPGYDELWHSLERHRAGRTLGVIGSFSNERRVVPVVLPSGLAIELEVDQARFPGGRVDQEVEIELPSPDAAAEVEAWLEGVARDAGVATAPSSPKIARFLQALSRAR